MLPQKRIHSASRCLHDGNPTHLHKLWHSSLYRVDGERSMLQGVAHVVLDTAHVVLDAALVDSCSGGGTLIGW